MNTTTVVETEAVQAAEQTQAVIDQAQAAAQKAAGTGPAAQDAPAAELRFIALSRLRLSRRDVRKTAAPVDSLAESIARVGLLQNLIVVPVPGQEDLYEVVAGGRRWAALRLLAKRKRIARDQSIPSLVVPDASAVTVSLTENVQRQDMHPADQFEAFLALVNEGRPVEDIAADFGVTPLVVQRRLRLARVSPRLLAMRASLLAWAMRVAPNRDGFINAIQVWPYSEGALYQVYASPGRVTLIQLQPGERLIDVSAGDTVRWIVGDSSSGSGATARANLQVKPVRAGLKTNLVVTTDRRIYLLELASTESAWMASASWDYPQDRMAELKKRNEEAQAATPLAAGVPVEQLRFRYDITGDTPPWRPLRAFDDGARVYIQFPAGIAQGELPPLFLVGPSGDLQLVNHQYRAPYYVVDRLFGAVELRLGGDDAKIVRISRNDVATARGGS